MFPCPFCSEPIPDGSQICPQCRKDIALVDENPGKWSGVISQKLPEDAIIKVLMMHHYKLHANFSFFYLAPCIPNYKLNHARTWCNLPEAERIIGYVETSRGTQSRTVVVFGSTAMFFRDTGYVSPFHERWVLGRIEQSSGRIPYPEFVKRLFEAKRLHIGVSLDKGQYLSIVDPLHRTIFVELLNSLKEVVTVALETRSASVEPKSGSGQR